MMRLLLVVLIAAFCSQISFGATPLPIIPTPLSHIVSSVSPVNLRLPLKYHLSDIDSFSCNLIQREMANISSILPAKNQQGAEIYFYMNSLVPEEGYTLTTDDSGIKLEASSRAGFLYGIVTLKRLMGKEVLAGVASDCNTIPSVVISDAPRFSYRGFMLDVSRHFFSAEQIKKMLSLMAAYKMNKFHWHLTDDQGWRLPVEEYPLLTTIGATHPVNTRMTDFSTQTEYYTTQPVGPIAYTEDEIRSIVDYAAGLNIDIIPEIEMPGHMAAAIAAYPYLSCYPDTVHKVRDLQGISKDVLDVSKPEVMDFVKTVIDRLIDLFPFEIIHIGGDETPTEAWQQSENCRLIVEKNGFEGANSEERFRKLQNHFTQEVNNYVKSKGKKLMTWDEIVTAPGADLELAMQIEPLVMAYDIVYDKPVEQCDALGLRCVYAPFGPYYINRRYSCDTIGAGKGRDDLESVYEHPVPSSSNIIGTQAVFWTEYVTLNKDLEYLALPRLIAIAENAWIKSEHKDFSRFRKLLNEDIEWLKIAGYNYAEHQIMTPQSH